MNLFYSCLLFSLEINIQQNENFLQVITWLCFQAFIKIPVSSDEGFCPQSTRTRAVGLGAPPAALPGGHLSPPAQGPRVLHPGSLASAASQDKAGLGPLFLQGWICCLLGSSFHQGSLLPCSTDGCRAYWQAAGSSSQCSPLPPPTFWTQLRAGDWIPHWAGLEPSPLLWRSGVGLGMEGPFYSVCLRTWTWDLVFLLQASPFTVYKIAPVL